MSWSRSHLKKNSEVTLGILLFIVVTLFLSMYYGKDGMTIGVGFIGSILGGLIGGAFTLIGVKQGILSQQKSLRFQLSEGRKQFQKQLKAETEILQTQIDTQRDKEYKESIPIKIISLRYMINETDEMIRDIYGRLQQPGRFLLDNDYPEEAFEVFNLVKGLENDLLEKSITIDSTTYKQVSLVFSKINQTFFMPRMDIIERKLPRSFFEKDLISVLEWMKKELQELVKFLEEKKSNYENEFFKDVKISQDT